MFSKKHLIWIMALMAAFVLFACSDDDDETPTGGTTPPTMDHTPTASNITIPAGLQTAAQTNDTAQMALDYINALTGFDSLLYYFTPQSAKLSNALFAPMDTLTWIYTFTYGEITYLYKWLFWETATTYYWQYIWDWDIYDNWVWFAAQEAKDGSGGQLVWYDVNTTNALFSWVWTYVGGVYNITFDAGSFRIEGQLNADGSGTVDYYVSSLLILRITWTAIGSGQWWTYDAGGETGSGFWIVTK